MIFRQHSYKELITPSVCLTVVFFLLTMGFLFIARLSLWLTNTDLIRNVSYLTWGKVLLTGFYFDTIVCSYFLLPFFLFSFFLKPEKFQKGVFRNLFVFYFIMGYILFTIILLMDIAYFNYFNTRISVQMIQDFFINWHQMSEHMVMMILGSYHYYLQLIIFAGVLYFLIRGTQRIYNRTVKSGAWMQAPIRKIKYIHYGQQVLLLLFLYSGTKGTFALKATFREGMGKAYVSDNLFLNNTTLNGVYTFTKSIQLSLKGKNLYLNYMPAEEATTMVAKYLDIEPDSLLSSPIARPVLFQEPSAKMHVVIIFLESLDRLSMGLSGRRPSPTPFLDSISQQAVFFENFYSSGIHTFNGVYSTLFGLPTLLNKHPMNTEETMQTYSGISNILAAEGYQTLFAGTGDLRYDNMLNFLKINGFQHFITLSDYPEGSKVNNWGVPDHLMYETVLDTLNYLAAQGHPFLAALLTCSNHPPYVIPQTMPFPFHPQTTTLREQIIEYTDQSLKYFFYRCLEEPWGRQTIFVLLGDHGMRHQPVYEIDLNYHHIPLILYAPAIIRDPIRITRLGGQIDVTPTIMGLLKIPYINNTLGVNLLNTERPYIYFNSDNILGCLDQSHLLIRLPDGYMRFYHHISGSTMDSLNAYPEKSHQMYRYATSMLQTTQWMIMNKKVQYQKLK